MDISIGLISKYRSQIMGLATLWVMTSHVRIPSSAGGFFNFFQYIGFGGVEMFMLVSGFGLFFALQKSISLHNYYYRRFVRIVPIWMIAIVLLYFLCSPFPLLSTEFVRRVGQCWWFVPFIIFIYIISPIVYAAVKSEKMWPSVLCIGLVLLLQVAYKVSGMSNITVTLSFARIFDFMIGLWLAKKMTEGGKLHVSLIVLAGLSGFIVVYLCNQDIIFEGFWTEHHDLRLYLMILTGPLMCLIAIVVSAISKYLSAILKWIGEMSFEVYLFHVLIWWIIRDDNLLPWYFFYPISLFASFVMHIVNKQLSELIMSKEVCKKQY